MSFEIEISDTDLLKKTIQILTCVIHGHSIRALLRKETKFLTQKTNADLIAIYIKKDEGHELDFISLKKRLLCQMMDKYGFTKQSPSFSKTGDDIINALNSNKHYLQTTDLYDVLKGAVTKTGCTTMKAETGFKTALFFPLFIFGARKIGFIGYYFLGDKTPDIDKLKEVSSMIRRLIEPLYDFQTSTFYSKCTQVDYEMSRLTEKEREIVHRVIRGMSYKEVAKELHISINTLKTHMKNIFSKYGVSSKLELNNTLLMHKK